MLLTLGGTFLRNHQYYRFFLLSGAAVVIVFLTIAYRDRLEQVLQKLHERHLRKRGKPRNRDQGGRSAFGRALFLPFLFPLPLPVLLALHRVAEFPDPVHDLPVERSRWVLPLRPDLPRGDPINASTPSSTRSISRMRNVPRGPPARPRPSARGSGIPGRDQDPCDPSSPRRRHRSKNPSIFSLTPPIG